MVAATVEDAARSGASPCTSRAHRHPESRCHPQSRCPPAATTHHQRPCTPTGFPTSTADRICRSWAQRPSAPSTAAAASGACAGGPNMGGNARQGHSQEELIRLPSFTCEIHSPSKRVRCCVKPRFARVTARGHATHVGLTSTSNFYYRKK